MFKFLSKFLIFFLLLLITTSLFLSYFGLETEKFNNLIKEKANAINQYVKIDFEKTKIYLNTSEFNLLIKLTNPKI